ncbi:MAG: hypothetical protein V3S70_09800 [Gammaproteobacteria bacterium]
MFIWGWIYWASGFASGTIIDRPADDAVAQRALTKAFQESGTYFVPGDMDDEEAWNKRREAGPLALVFYQKEGAPAMQPMIFTQGFVHYFLTCLLIGVLMRMVLSSLASYGDKVKFTTLAGVAASFFTNLSDAIWMTAPLDYQIFVGIYDITVWVIAGLVLGKFIGRDKPAAPSQAA